VVWPISWCCSLKSSGVKTSSGVRDSSRKLPPEILFFGTAVVVAMFLPNQKRLARAGRLRVPYFNGEWARKDIRESPAFMGVLWEILA